MKLDNLTPEQLEAWQAMQQENRRLKEKMAALESGAEPSPAMLSRPEFVREVARMAAHDARYGGTSSLLTLSFEGLQEQRESMGDLHRKILQTIVDTLAHGVRNCDIVGRTGPENFGIFLTRCPAAMAEKKAVALVEKLQNQVNPLLQNN